VGAGRWVRGLRLTPAQSWFAHELQEGFDGADGSIHKTSASPEREANWGKNPRKICEGMIFVNKTSSLFDKFVKQSRRNTRIGA
jgi:hypothetical protein